MTLVKKLYNIFVPHYSGRPWYYFFFFIFVRGSYICFAYKENGCKNFSHFELEEQHILRVKLKGMNLALNYGPLTPLGKAVYHVCPSTHFFICKITILLVNPSSPTQISHLMTEETSMKTFMKYFTGTEFDIIYEFFFFTKLDLKTW